ncbi:hypothetical protein [Flavobacterium columnare]|uniref:Uncharacterized protein n=1 Tax=Flavobacterium columnare TaxID=996 RepID=A0AA94F5A7_9FLAO|nr:hypothetical protein [Flavobacterium columnare]MCH4829158.1 hypothetical protein [Flavobacterium columnare]MCH4833934.1 hypothetical protein [Flavobacterium columnare]
MNSNVIPLRIVDKGNTNLLLLIKDEFTENNLVSLINLAKNLNNLQATNVTYFSFPNYNKFEHEQTVANVLALKGIDENFKSQIKVVKHNIDFRNNE